MSLRNRSNDWEGPNMFSHWLEDEEPFDDGTGLLFRHWTEDHKSADDGTGLMFRHWLDD